MEKDVICVDSKKLEALAAAAEQGSFTRAAELLGYTQSGLTHMMNSLEREIGFPVLVRDRRGGSVMTIFEIDQPVPAAELEQLKAVPQVLGVIYYEKEDD